MIGKKKLSTIRQELRDALVATDDDPILWLESRMGAAKETNVSEGAEVLESLSRVLEAQPTNKKRRSQASTKE